MGIYIAGDVFEYTGKRPANQAVIERFIREVGNLPKPAVRLHGEEGFEQFDAKKSCFALTGEACFISPNANIKFIGSLGSATNLQFTLWNDEGECFHTQFHSGISLDWEKIFGLFTHKKLKMQILGGTYQPVSNTIFGNRNQTQSLNSLRSLTRSLFTYFKEDKTFKIKLDIVYQFCMKDNVVKSLDGTYANDELSARIYKANPDDPSHRSHPRTKIGTIPVPRGIESPIIIQNGLQVTHTVRGNFLKDMAVDSKGSIFEVSTENLDSNFEAARKCREYDASMREDHMPGNDLKQHCLLVCNNHPIDFQFTGGAADLNFINFHPGTLQYAVERSKLDDIELRTYFETQVAPVISQGGSKQRHSAFADQRIEIIKTLASMVEKRDTARREFKSPGPWAEGFRYPAPDEPKKSVNLLPI